MINLLASAPNVAVQRVGQQVFRKQVLRYGRWMHPADSKNYFEVNKDLCEKLVRNFDLANFNDYIPVFMAQDQSDPHKVLPTDTVGRVVGLQSDADGLYALMEFGSPDLSDKADRNLIPGVSAAISLNYTHKEKGQDVGPVLRHIVLCNEPYIKNLRGFQQVQFSEKSWDVLEFAEPQRSVMTREQQEALAKKLGIDPTKFPAEGLFAEMDRVVATTNVQLAEFKPKADKHDVLLSENTTLKAEVATLKAGSPDAAKVVELSEKVRVAETQATALQTKVHELELAGKRTAANARVEQLIQAGKAEPKRREALIELAMASPATFDKIYDNDSPVVIPLGERGVTPTGDKLGDHSSALSPDKVKAEVDRLSAAYSLKKTG